MDLPETDIAFLTRKGFTWEFLPEGGGACLVIAGFPVSAEVYDRAPTDLMLRIPAQYNMAALDMFYVDPPLRLRNGGGYPQAANQFEDHAGRRWQRFSRHLVTAWRPGIDGLPMFFVLIQKELQAKG